MERIEHSGEVFELSEIPITLNGIHALSITIVHTASRRVKSGTTMAAPETLIQSLLYDLCSDLDDGAAGNMPLEAGRFENKASCHACMAGSAPAQS